MRRGGMERLPLGYVAAYPSGYMRFFSFFRRTKYFGFCQKGFCDLFHQLVSAFSRSTFFKTFSHCFLHYFLILQQVLFRNRNGLPFSDFWVKFHRSSVRRNSFPEFRWNSIIAGNPKHYWKITRVFCEKF